MFVVAISTCSFTLPLWVEGVCIPSNWKKVFINERIAFFFAPEELTREIEFFRDSVCLYSFGDWTHSERESEGQESMWSTGKNSNLLPSTATVSV